jgi:hypothetical protein
MLKSVATSVGIFLLLLLCPNDLDAQASPEREKWAGEVFELVYKDFEMSVEERGWLKEILLRSCACSHLKEQNEMEACGKELLEFAGLPQTEEDFRNLTAAQKRKLELINPISMSVGSCPE